MKRIPLRSMLSKCPQWIYFTLFMVICLAFTGVFAALTLDPQGIHFIRQTDSLSFASNYYHFDYGFFEPHVYNLSSSDGAAACEFPILYYITALIYTIAGEHTIVLRLLNLLILSIGFVALFRTTSKALNNALVSSLLMGISFTSTVVLYYTSNVLVDAAALGFSLIALAQFVEFNTTHQKKFLWSSVLFFTLACLLKITFGIWPIALLLATWTSGQFSKKSLSVWPLLLSVCFAWIWFSWAKVYNQQHGDAYFLTSAIPVWQLTAAEYNQFITAISHYWIGAFYYAGIRWIIALAAVLVLWKQRMLSSFERHALAISLVGIACYVALFARQFINHDYYFLPGVPFVILLMIALFRIVLSMKKTWIVNAATAAIAIVLVGGLVYSRHKLESRFHSENDPYDDATKSLSAALNAHQLPRPQCSERVVIIGDPSKNGCLMELKCKGYVFAEKAAFIQAMNAATIENVSLIYSTESLSDSIAFSRKLVLESSAEEWRAYRVNP
jgi:hypothetical protein